MLEALQRVLRKNAVRVCPATPTMAGTQGGPPVGGKLG